MARTVLIADDSPTIQRRASGILTGEGWEVVTVSNGVAAIKKLPALKPLVALADVSMPGRDGYEVCQFIKQTAGLKHVSVVLIYSDDDPYEDAKGGQVGADARIRKPFDPDELIKIVNRLADQSVSALTPQPIASPPPPPEFSMEMAEPEPAPENREPTTAPPAIETNLAFVPEAIAFEQQATEEQAEIITSQKPETVSETEFALESRAVQEIQEPELAAPEPSPAAGSLAATEPELVEAPPTAQVEGREEPEHSHPHEPATFFHVPEEIGEPILSDAEEIASPREERSGASAITTDEVSVPSPEEIPNLSEEAERAIEEPPELPPENAVSDQPRSDMLIESEPRSASSESELPAAPASAAEIEEAQTAPRLEASAPAPEDSGSSPSSPPDASSQRVSEVPAGTSGTHPLDVEQVAEIVHRVVAKMSPQAMPSAMIEEIARRITDEILPELKP